MCCLCESLHVQSHGSCEGSQKYVHYVFWIWNQFLFKTLRSLPTAAPVPGELSVALACCGAPNAGVLQNLLRAPRPGGVLLRLCSEGPKQLQASSVGAFARHSFRQTLPLTLQIFLMHYCLPSCLLPPSAQMFPDWQSWHKSKHHP